LDGTGLGYDGTIWGGEILSGGYDRFCRFASFESMPLPGGDAAIRSPWKTAAAWLYRIFGENVPSLPFLTAYPAEKIFEMVERGVNTVETSSCGRLFDAVAAMSGGKKEAHYEAQAAIEMMNVCGDTETAEPYDIKMVNFEKFPVADLIKEIVKDIVRGLNFESISTRFHRTLVELLTEFAVEAGNVRGIGRVVLSGGVFQNYILLRGLRRKLEKSGFEVFVPEKLPVNDGGIALGQAAIARELLKKGMDEVKYCPHCPY
jgi:hydrogenase maturation protein HypF